MESYLFFVGKWKVKILGIGKLMTLGFQAVEEQSARVFGNGWGDWRCLKVLKNDNLQFVKEVQNIFLT